MEKFEELMDAAQKKLKIAEHLLTVTYPLVKDPKLLFPVAENLFLAFSYGIGSLLYYERLYKRVPPFPDDFKSKFGLFREECSARYNIDKTHIAAMQDLREIILAHKKSPMSFSRKESFIICDQSYFTRTLSYGLLKGYTEKAKLFIKKLSTIIKKASGDK